MTLDETKRRVKEYDEYFEEHSKHTYALNLTSRICSTTHSIFNYIKNITEKSDIKALKSKLIKDCFALNKFYYEAYIISDANTLSAEKVSEMKDIFLDMHLVSRLKRLETTEEFINLLAREFIEDVNKNSRKAAEITENNYVSMMNLDFMNKFIDQAISEKIASSIKGNRRSNTLLINPYTLDFISGFVNNKHNVYYLDNDRGYENISWAIKYSNDICKQEDLDNHIKGKIKGFLSEARISNNVFDIVAVSSKMYPTHRVIKSYITAPEKEDLMVGFRYLRPGGLYIATFPYSRLSDSVAFSLSKKLKNMSIYRIDKSDIIDQTEYANCSEHYYRALSNNTVVIIGTKVALGERNKEEEELEYRNFLLKARSNINRYGDLYKVNLPNYLLKKDPLEISLFRGLYLDKTEVLNFAKESSLSDDIINKQSVLYENDRRPLLPFSIGQIGLVLTSGELNGIIKDNDGIAHVIKAETIKESNTVKEDNGETIKATETISNRVQIAAISSSGEYKRIN